MDDVLTHHQASEEARARAEAAGLDLNHLKSTDPQQYKMLTAQRLVVSDQRFVERISAVFFAAFRHYDLFQLTEGDKTVLLAFPELTSAELKKLDNALGRLVALAEYEGLNAYYRVINDPQGEHRELALPVAPSDWQGEAGVLVGPFASQSKAEAWGEAHVQDKDDLVYDALPHASSWYCDIFSEG